MAAQFLTEETVPPSLTGLSRPLTVVRVERKANLIVQKWHGDQKTFCPPTWADLAIGSGACGLGCRACFLMLTFRGMRDPLKHHLYSNYGDFESRTAGWLKDPGRRPFETLGIGVDRSDSLLYEGVTGHIRRLAPLFGDPGTNPQGLRMVLLTKTANVGWLSEVAPADRKKVVVTFSLNPEKVADAWEGKWPDTLERITPPVEHRLRAAAAAQEFGYEVRVRLDPILPVEGWEDLYRDFFGRARALGLNPSRWTLGTYREKNAQLDLWREKWGLPAMEYEPETLDREGTHRHTVSRERLYTEARTRILETWPGTKVGLCKETHRVRKDLGFCNADCNCLS